MLISDYDQFVRETDQSLNLPEESRRKIAIYGLASEIGSIASAIKKRLLLEDGNRAWNAPNSELVEELGDAMWYCFALARAANPNKPINIFLNDIRNLRKELLDDNERSARIVIAIGQENRGAFLEGTRNFPRRTREMTFASYQSVALLTARTKERALAEVCIAVLYQLSSELLRTTLPPVEAELNKAIRERELNSILGEIAWHISALASVHKVSLDEVAAQNRAKVLYRSSKENPTPLHDDDYPLKEQFPRKFEISFVTVARGKAQMYWNGRRLGDQLTDNSYDDDGYRFHDVMHLANLTYLGWSPVLRGLMGLKRKSRPRTDEIEDGARAKIVEEAVIKSIHSAGQKLAETEGIENQEAIRLFPRRDEISFKFLKQIRSLVAGLEVQKNRYWEWESAIVDGYEIFHELRMAGQGTIRIDLKKRKMEFSPHVSIPLAGRVVGIGTATADGKSSHEDSQIKYLTKIAILTSLGFLNPSEEEIQAIDIAKPSPESVSVATRGRVREAMWNSKIIAFKVSIAQTSHATLCTALAMSDE